MKPKEVKYILDNLGKKSPKEMAGYLGLKERKVRKFIELKAGHKTEGNRSQTGRWADQLPNINTPDILNYFYFKLFAIIIICGLGFIVYSNTFHCPFEFDDEAYIGGNFSIRNILDLFDIWKFYPCRFVTFFSFALNYYFHQFDVFSYHVFNLVVHLFSAILVWWLVLLTLSTPAMKENKITMHANLIALFAGLIFVTHPVQTEAVTYICQRAASMGTLFYLASLSLYVKSRLQQDDRPGSGLVRIYYILSLIIAIIAMFTKENAITLPLMIILYEICFFEVKRSFNWKPLIPFLLTIFIIPITLFLNKTDRLKEIHEVVQSGGITPLNYLITEFRVMFTYIRLLFFPLNQNLDYDYPVFKSIFGLPVLISFLLLLVILIWAKRIFPKYRLVSFSIFWFFLALLPESSLLPFQDVIFEHRLYLPLVGYSIFLASGIYYLLGHLTACSSLFGKNSTKLMVIALMMIIICNSFLTYQRNKVWKNEISLWNDTIQKSPHKARGYCNRGNGYFEERNDLIQALSDFNKSIELEHNLPFPYYSRGNLYLKQNKFAQAISDFTKAIELYPQYSQAYYNRGLSYVKEGILPQARLDFTKAIEIDPKNEDAYNNRGSTYFKLGNFTQALADYNKAIEINPKSGAYSNRAIVFYQLKEYDKAWADEHKAEELGYSVNAESFGRLKTKRGNNVPII